MIEGKSYTPEQMAEIIASARVTSTDIANTIIEMLDDDEIPMAAVIQELSRIEATAMAEVMPFVGLQEAIRNLIVRLAVTTVMLAEERRPNGD